MKQQVNEENIVYKLYVAKYVQETKAHCVRAKTKVSAEISLLFFDDVTRKRKNKKAVVERFHNTRTRQKERGILCWRLLHSSKEDSKRGPSVDKRPKKNSKTFCCLILGFLMKPF